MAQKNVEKKIICQKYMKQEETDELTDYKFFCFNGEPGFLYVSDGLENHDTARISFVTTDWQFADFKRSDYKRHEELPKKPEKYEEMLEIAEVKKIMDIGTIFRSVIDKFLFNEFNNITAAVRRFITVKTQRFIVNR